MITWTKRLILTASFLALITTNVLTLTNTAFNAALSGLMSTALGVQTVSDALRGKVDAQKKIIKNRKVATRKFGTKVTKRTKKLVATTLAEITDTSVLPWLCSGQFANLGTERGSCGSPDKLARTSIMRWLEKAEGVGQGC